MRMMTREQAGDKQNRSKCFYLHFHLIIPINEISLSLTLIAPSSAGNKAAT